VRWRDPLLTASVIPLDRNIADTTADHVANTRTLGASSSASAASLAPPLEATVRRRRV